MNEISQKLLGPLKNCPCFFFSWDFNVSFPPKNKNHQEPPSIQRLKPPHPHPTRHLRRPSPWLGEARANTEPRSPPRFLDTDAWWK